MTDRPSRASDRPAVAPESLYRERRLAEAYPGLDEDDLEAFVSALEALPDRGPRMERLWTYLDRLVDLGTRSRVAVIGCGPRPHTLDWLVAKGLQAVGVEPVASFAQAGRAWLVGRQPTTAEILEGSAEKLPLADGGHDLIFCESVLEHVDSPRRSLEEMHRVLAPGGLLLVVTTNRYALRLRGDNGEFNRRWFNWFPPLVRESYVFRQLHYEPGLANHTSRPAVHWFSYSELCGLGRDAGFGRFYSLLDLLRPSDPSVRRSPLRRLVLRPVQHNPWLRALALTQVGGTVVMLKRG
jgi:SAM-dependent methyltransferase